LNVNFFLTAVRTQETNSTYICC